jgi:hypothetical protein
MAVTGVSTGALIAPFAFMGPDYDAHLESVFTTISTKDIMRKRTWLAAATSDALADIEPLRALLSRHINGKFLDDFVRECNRGRQLLIATTNLDSGRPVQWRLCDIALSGHPQALELIREIILASASVPGAFPPVIFEVETEDGQRFDELHVDGGVTAQVFLYSSNLDFRQALDQLGIEGAVSVYVIRNSTARPQWKAVKPTIGALVGRSIDSLTKYQGMGDIYRIFLGAQKDGLDFNLAYIPDSFEATSKELFDPAYMRALFDFAYQLALNGYPWVKNPVELAPPIQ